MEQEIVERVKGIGRSVARKTGIDADDLIQEGLIAVWRAKDRFDGRGTLVGWCSVRAKGAMLDYCRDLVESVKGGKDYKHVPIENQRITIAPTGPANVLHRELQEVVAVANLTDRERFIVVENYLKERSKEEIALDLGISVTRMSQLRDKALIKIREQLWKKNTN